jgi:predicted transcriptional regulator
MGAKSGKIEKHNLGPRVLHLLLKEGKTSSQIAEILTKDGFKVSQPTVSRFIKANREKARDEVQDLIHDHVQREIPKDMTALEDMEQLCLAWAKEEPDTTAERIALWGKVQAQIPAWREKILSYAQGSDEEKAVIIKEFIQLVSRWLFEDLNMQKQRINAMRMATGIIDTKLKYSGVLQTGEGSNIIISGDEDERDEERSDREDRTLRLVGKDDGE